MKRNLYLAALCLGLLAGSIPAHLLAARTTATPSGPVGQEEITGFIDSIDNESNSIVIDDRTFQFATDTEIHGASRSGLRKGMKASIKYTGDAHQRQLKEIRILPGN